MQSPYLLIKALAIAGLILIFSCLSVAMATGSGQLNNSSYTNSSQITTVTTDSTTSEAIEDESGNVQHYCPDASELIKNDLWWSARDGRWKSYSESFADSIDNFIGAQWLGAVVGKIICIYQGKQSFDFPISLEPAKTAAILEPKGSLWTAKAAGVKICHSSNTHDCPFATSKPQENSDIYQQIAYDPNRNANNFNVS